MEDHTASISTGFYPPQPPRSRGGARPSSPAAPTCTAPAGCAPADASPASFAPRRSNNHIYAQVIDDTKGHVVASASTTEPESKDAGWGGNCGAATVVGKRVGARALEKGIKTVHFDRNGQKYHGRIAALADGAREAGLSF